MKFNRLKRTLFLLLWIVLPLLTFGNAQQDALFVKGNNAYAKARYKEALDTYQKIVSQGYNSAAVYFNMGNASYKLDDIPSALLYYEKAHKISPSDEDINFNIRFVNSKTSDKIDEVPEFFLSVWFKSVILSISANALSILSLAFVLSSSAFLIVYFFANATLIKKSSFFTALVFFFFGILSVFILNSQAGYFEDHRQGIIFSSTVTVKSEPAETSRSLFVIHEGAKVDILDKNNAWVKVKLANGNEGWMRLSDLKEI